ncbi:MAG: cyclopropane-fatty-acyl-phospholipid synthase family protein [Rhodobacteraceae bacterium]|nr:cyclopropane-fatty-acyl-phospholipid synthase family protein [Paracoccaceae bacterium]
MWTALFDRFARDLIRTGTLVVHLPDGTARQYGDGSGAPVTIRLRDPGLVRRILVSPDLAVGEGYMDGTLTIDDDDLAGFIALAVGNMAAGGAWLWRRPADIARLWMRRLAQFNPAGRARRNVAHHYDLSGRLYELFLDADRQYSCAYFREPGMSLEAAQAAKKAHVAAKLLLSPGMRVLDIGCGWGGMALTLAREHGAQVLGVTLSAEQHRVATERARAAGLSDQVEFRLADYRTVTGRFDRIVSVGMFEHVGVPHYRTYFGRVRELLADDGVALIHTIGRASPPGSTSPWVLKYIFPGGYVPAMSEVMAAVEREGLWPADVEVWRLHYAETLRHWHDRFMASLGEVRALYDDRFVRMWRYYLVGAEMTFRHNAQCVFQFQLARRQDAVPLARDYLYRDAAPLPLKLSHAAE